MSVRRCSRSRCSGNEAVPAFLQESDLPARQAQIAPVQQQQEEQRINAGYQEHATTFCKRTWLSCARTQAQSATLQPKCASCQQHGATQTAKCTAVVLVPSTCT